MKRDYNRSVCRDCYIKEECIEYRNKSWCIGCKASLLCLMNNSIDIVPVCDVTRGHWQTLPDRCPLANKLMRVYPQDNSVYIKNKFGDMLCPRCLQKFEIVTTRWDTRHGYCAACGLVTLTVYITHRSSLCH